MFLGNSLDKYERASSAKVNWGKSQALQVGQWADKVMPKLPGNLSWGKQGMTILGVFWEQVSLRGRTERVLWRECVPDCLNGNGCYLSFPTGGGS